MYDDTPDDLVFGMTPEQAGAARLSVACGWWRLSAEARPLTPAHPAGDEEADDAWQRDRDEEHRRANEQLAMVRDIAATLRQLEAGEHLDVAVQAQRRVFGVVIAWRVHGVGIGWRTMPQVDLPDAGSTAAV